MKFRCKFGPWFLGVIIFIIISLYAICISWLFNDKIFLSLLLIVITTFIVWVSFGVKYCIYDENLVVKVAFLKFAIKTKSIIEIKKSVAFLSFFIRSRNCVQLNVVLNDGKIKSVYVSPSDYELFYSKLKEKSGNIVIDENSTD